MVACTLKAFKARLDGALSKVVCREVSLPIAGGWNYMILKVPSSPSLSVILRCRQGEMRIFEVKSIWKLNCNVVDMAFSLIVSKDFSTAVFTHA